MNDSQYNLEGIFKEIEGSPDSVGYDISLSKVYDAIKEAKFEEDDNVSFGIWEHDLKKADWPKTLQLCIDALSRQSKDLQILGCLLEALANLEGFGGILKAIEILNEFISKFWLTCYPRTEDNSSDQEQKIRILNWIYSTIEKRSRFIPFINDGVEVSLYSYDYAIEMKNTMLRDPNSAQEVLSSAAKINMKSLEEIQGIIKAADASKFNQTLSVINSIKIACDKLKDTIANFIDNAEPAFSNLLTNLDKIRKIISVKSQEPIADAPARSPKLNSLSERDDIYDEINMLAQRLAVIEKHSPSSYILNLVVSWKNKTLLEIINDIKTGTSESHKLLKFLVS